MNTAQHPSFVQKLWTLALNDVRQIFRDPVLSAILIFPVATIFLVRYGLPLLIREWPILEPYTLSMIGLICVVNASFPAYVVSFVMLDEKDADLFTAMRVTPVSTLLFVGYRLVFITLLGGGFAFFTLLGVREIPFEGVKILLVSLLCGLGTPMTTLAIVTFARNKIEGITLLKGLNFVFILPFLAFFTDSIWRNALGIIPYYWTYQAFGEWEDSGGFYLVILVGILSHLLVLGILYHQFRKRIF